MFPIPVIPKTKKTTSTVDNIVSDLSLERFCMHVCNLKWVGKIECLKHKPSFLYFLHVVQYDLHGFLWIFI